MEVARRCGVLAVLPTLKMASGSPRHRCPSAVTGQWDPAAPPAPLALPGRWPAPPPPRQAIFNTLDKNAFSLFLLVCWGQTLTPPQVTFCEAFSSAATASAARGAGAGPARRAALLPERSSVSSPPSCPSAQQPPAIRRYSPVLHLSDLPEGQSGDADEMWACLPQFAGKKKGYSITA